ncbi:AAA family ATPase [candidate division KSB1 bacterium]|nr:AAA family ATPase [candidate division KSB1 bacterium]
MNSNLLVRIDDKQYGPISTSELKGLVKSGNFSLADEIWLEDEGEWVEAEKIEEIKRLFMPTAVPETEKKIIAMGSGKGGVGKTVLAASMGIGLAALGKEVVLVDGDFGGANLHTCMGILSPQYTFLDYYTLQQDSLEDILLDTPINNLKLISGACGILGIANPKYSQKVRLVRELKKLDANYIIMDLGAGSALSVIDFFISVDEGIVITSPEPTAIQESFDFIKLCLLRKLQREFRNEQQVLTLLEVDGVNSLSQFTTPIEILLEKANKISSEVASRMETNIREFKPRLILNMIMDSDEIKEGASIKTAAAELLSLDIDYMGYVEYDEDVHDSVKDLRPFIIHNPKSKASRSIARLITVKLLKMASIEAFVDKRKMRKNINESAKSFPLAEDYESNTICSVKCFYWDDCEYQNGGYPCKIRRLEPLFKG